ncbi:MAG: CotH kinase family protein [Granulicella sp.]
MATSMVGLRPRWQTQFEQMYPKTVFNCPAYAIPGNHDYESRPNLKVTTFHLHGTSTALMPKKAYNLKLTTSVDLLTAMGLTCPYVNSSGGSVCDKSKSYVLLANYDDKTFLRDWSASALANAISSGGDYLSYAPNSPSPSGTSAPAWWAPHSLFVELYINGTYEGNYQLIEVIKVDSHRININEMKATDISGAGLTGGYRLEIDQRQDEDFTFTTPRAWPSVLMIRIFHPKCPSKLLTSRTMSILLKPHSIQPATRTQSTAGALTSTKQPL